jgi:hypothetical protein
METYSYSEAKQKLSLILDKAKRVGRVLIRRKDGSVFEVKSISFDKSPLDVKGVDVKLGKDEILDLIREIRKR